MRPSILQCLLLRRLWLVFMCKLLRLMMILRFILLSITMFAVNSMQLTESRLEAVRDLSNLVKPDDVIISEHLVTLNAVVPSIPRRIGCHVTRHSRLMWSPDHPRIYMRTMSMLSIEEHYSIVTLTILELRHAKENFKFVILNIIRKLKRVGNRSLKN